MLINLIAFFSCTINYLIYYFYFQTIIFLSAFPTLFKRKSTNKLIQTEYFLLFYKELQQRY